ncbi:MAG: EAL domain-containing protein [Methyloceanibacter sp.]|uniref:EAL domain-containing protein n=1 Tax=Methyloceanibacter sp. TaxID=1965321 RepID=UPI003D6C7FF9
MQDHRFGASPIVCIFDQKPHIRRFVREALGEFGFSVYECREPRDFRGAVNARSAELLILSLSGGAGTAREVLCELAVAKFQGRVLPLASRDLDRTQEAKDVAEKLGLTVLPPLFAPFNKERLLEIVAPLFPGRSAPSHPDLSEALREDWLELWYQPKIDTRRLVMRGAEALLRVRHPIWGVVPSSFLIPDDGDPRLLPVSEAVISRAVEDWRHFFFARGPVEIAINLPIAFLEHPESMDYLRQALPRDAAFEGLLIESNGTDIARNLSLIRDIAKELRPHKVALSIDDLGAEWLSFIGLHDFPFVEVKVDRKLVAGCAKDRLKQSLCRNILALANGYGARTVAEGVETWADFLTVRELGFDLVQGFLFAKPMSPQKFSRACWTHVRVDAKPVYSTSFDVASSS